MMDTSEQRWDNLKAYIILEEECRQALKDYQNIKEETIAHREWISLGEGGYLGWIAAAWEIYLKRKEIARENYIKAIGG